MLAAVVAAVFAPPAAAAVRPVTWCGDGASATDRPDVVGGDEIHVVYAVPNDGADRFTQVASEIATDMGAISDWWRRQDGTRAPRFDLAAFSCSGAGSLDVSDVRLPHPTPYYNQVSVPRIQLLRDDLVAAGFDDPAKKYLVYYEQAQPSASSDCGAAYVNAQSGGTHGYAAVYVAPNLGGCGSVGVGGFSAVVAAHELASALGALDPATPGPPHRCTSDTLHVCDNTLDVLASSPTATTLASAILDYGRDDYYAHSEAWWDVQDSGWLRRLDAGEYRVRVTVGDGGRTVVDTKQTGLQCASRCSWTLQAGSQPTLSAAPAPGYRFVRWIGCPTATGATCGLTVERPYDVVAVFAPPLRVTRLRLAFSRDRRSLTATAQLSAAGRADRVACSFASRPSVTSSLRGTVASCTWSVPARFHGHRVRGALELEANGETLVAKRFRVRVPRAPSR